MHLICPFYLLECKFHGTQGLCFPITSDLSTMTGSWEKLSKYSVNRWKNSLYILLLDCLFTSCFLGALYVTVKSIFDGDLFICRSSLHSNWMHLWWLIYRYLFLCGVYLIVDGIFCCCCCYKEMSVLYLTCSSQILSFCILLRKALYTYFKMCLALK